MVKCVSRFHKRYPQNLKQIKGSPKQLYYKGTLNDEILSTCLGVVGSRRMSLYGEKITKRVVSEVASFGVTIVLEDEITKNHIA